MLQRTPSSTVLTAALLTLGSALVLTGCGSPRQQRITLTGSSTVAPLVNEIGKQFERQNPGWRVDVQMGGSSRGIADARSGSAMVGMVSRKLKPDESDLLVRTIALDGVAMIVNTANPVKTLNDGQIKAIYTGKVRNWSEVGGKAAPITVVNKAEGRSTLELFLKHFKLEANQVKASVVIGDNQQGILTVSKDPNAIGYVSIGTAGYEAAHGAAIKLLPLEGVPATLAAVKDGRYPLSRPLNLVTKPKPPAAVQRFLDYAGSAQVDGLIEKQFFVVPHR
ncbi:MAG: phosphate ABC transporter substrate-binding protein [Vulcanococcus sp.]